MRDALAKLTGQVNWRALAAVWALLLIAVAGLVATESPDAVVAVALLVIAMAAGAAVIYRTLAEVAERHRAGGSARIRLETSEAHQPRDGRAAPELATLPAWVLALLGPGEGRRYAEEWSAHLHHRIEDGQIHEARVDRRRIARRALVLALTGTVGRFARWKVAIRTAEVIGALAIVAVLLSRLL